MFKQKGDEILIPTFNNTIVSDHYSVEKLTFTYMNAGYVGHCMNCSPNEVDNGTVSNYSAADETLTATVCEIYKKKIVIRRFSKDGEHQLGGGGCENPYFSDAQLIPVKFYSKSVESPQIIYRNRNHTQ